MIQRTKNVSFPESKYLVDKITILQINRTNRDTFRSEIFQIHYQPFLQSVKK